MPLIEDNRFIVIDEYPVFEMPACGLGKCGFFEVFTFSDKVSNALSMASAS